MVDLSLIDAVFKELREDIQQIKAEHPEEWAEYEKCVTSTLP